MINRKSVKRVVETAPIESATCDFCGKKINLGKNMVGDYIISNCSQMMITQYDSLGRMANVSELQICKSCMDCLKGMHLKDVAQNES